MGGAKSRDVDQYSCFRQLISPSTIRHSQLHYLSGVGAGTCPFGEVGCVVCIATGATHCLAILAGGIAYAWGNNRYSQLGDGAVGAKRKATVTIPEPVYFPKTFSQVVISKVAVGEAHSAVITEDGVLLTWGLGTEGQLGYEGNLYSVKQGVQSIPREVAGMNDESAEDITCGRDFTAVLTESGHIVTFGCGKYGALGQNALGSSSRPMTVKEAESKGYAGVRFVQVRAGWEHCLALSEDGKVYYWGNQYHARNNKEDICKVPRVLDNFSRCSVKSVSCGFDHSVVFGRSEFNQSHHQVFTWGCNEQGQLGYETCENTQRTPMQVVGVGEGLLDAGAGKHYTALLRDNGEVISWGNNPHISPHSTPSVPIFSASVVYRPPTPSQKPSSLICGFDQIWFLREADYSYSVATMLDTPGVDDTPPRHQRTVSHDVKGRQEELEEA